MELIAIIEDELIFGVGVRFIVVEGYAERLCG